MLIDFEREGGYAPLRLKYHANTDDIPEDAKKRLLDLIKSSDIMELKQSDLAPTRAQPDAFSYRINVSGGGKRNSLMFDDITAPLSLRPLLVLLQELSLEQAASE